MIPPLMPDDETHRLATLRSTGLLDSAPEERFDRVTRLARRLFAVPIALVSLVDADRQWFKSKQGLTATETSRDVSFCAHAILGDEPLVVENAADDARFADNPLVTGDPAIRFYAGYPLAAADGSKLGTLCIISDAPRQLSADDRMILQTLASMVESELASLDVTTTDALTGLANLRGFLETGEFILRLAKKLRQPLRLLLLQAGEGAISAPDSRSLLVSVARELLAGLEGCDLLARIGPREFAAIVAGTQEPAGSAGVSATGTWMSYDPSRHASLEELLSDAERVMAQQSPAT
jgi:GAF domain-containing protein